MSHDRPGSTPSLPAWKAFVVQFAADAGGRGSACSGRIEHLSSGRRARFESREEMIALMDRLLDEFGEQDE